MLNGCSCTSQVALYTTRIILGTYKCLMGFLVWPPLTTGCFCINIGVTKFNILYMDLILQHPVVNLPLQPSTDLYTT